MAKVTVKAKFDILSLLDRFVDARTTNEMGRAVVDEAKALIATGQSPVQGYGRFEAYKDRTKYPGKLKDARPVNLFLSGDMLDAYDYRAGKRDSIDVGVIKGSPAVRERAQAHNDGEGHLPQRRIVPGQGEKWAVSIMRRISDVWSRRLGELIRQSNKKK